LKPQSYPPAQQRGRSLHITLIIILLVILAVCIWQASMRSFENGLILWSLAGLAFFAPLPILIYRVYALSRGDYLLDRETLTIRWGLRLEQIPVSDVEWVRPADDLSQPLHRPLLSMPGAILGTRRHPDLGLVEFMADDTSNLLLVVTAKRVFAISPADAALFTLDFQRIVEMGSLANIPHRSIYPSFVVMQAWQNPLVRFLWFSGFFLNIGLLIWVSLLAPGLEEVPLGFLTTGVPRSIVPGVQLFLLPIISSLFYAITWLAGLYQYRRPAQRGLAFFTWGFSALSGAFFLMAVMFIISAKV
jgi:hypothetical protein